MKTFMSQGYCDPRYKAVREEFDRRLNSGDDFGGSIAVIEHGELVVDLWGGFADQAKTQPWQADTIVNTWSITKTMTAMAALLLIDRGQLDLDAPVANYWPEFAQAGKESVLVRHLLSHSSGIAGWDAPIDIADICDIPKSTARLAAQEPWWEPGTASGYHVLSFGHLIGEVVRQITGKTLATFFHDEIAVPLNADFHISLPVNEHSRVAEIIPMPPPSMSVPPDSVAFKAFTGPPLSPDFVNSSTWQSAGVGAAGGQGNARAMAEIQCVLSHGGKAKGLQLLKPETIDLALQSQVIGEDLVLGVPINFGLGYGLGESGFVPFIPARRIAFWGGAGGSLLINDLERETTFAYVMNRMEADAMLGNQNSIAYYSIFDQVQTENL
jgi:CubicO group peptidase (beta-lactamase class C family)